jgi:hypothetical protein
VEGALLGLEFLGGLVDVGLGVGELLGFELEELHGPLVLLTEHGDGVLVL